jgi:hypothetical protein
LQKERVMKKNVYFAAVPIVGVALILGFGLVGSPGHGYVSVPPPAFQPSSATHEFTLSMNMLQHLSAYTAVYYAPVYLPQGATVTKFTLYYSDASGSDDSEAILFRTGLEGSYWSMASVQIAGSAGIPLDVSDTTINYSLIDNSQYAYLVGWAAAGGSFHKNYGVIIEYTYGVSLPAVLRNF